VWQQEDGCIDGTGFTVEGVDPVDVDVAVVNRSERHTARVADQDSASNTSRATARAVLAAGKPAYPLAW
jgi:hypothetical protein